MSIDTFLLSADTTDLNYPEVRPTLDLNFARVKALDPRITFTRSSGGSYVGADGLIKYAGVNEARFDHDPSTGESLGLLVEEARTNLVTDSNTYTLGSNSTITIDNSITSPDGTTGVQKVNSNITEGIIYSASNNIANSSGSAQNYTWSVFIKKGNPLTSNISIQFGVTNTAALVYNFNTDIITNFSAVSFGRTLYPNGWVRLYGMTSIPNGSTFNLIVIVGNVEIFGGIYANFYQWGAQVEAGAFPTSYIPTEASTRTRAADDASITGKNFSEWYRQDEGTVLVIYAVPSFPFTNRTIFGISSSFSNRINDRLDNQNSIAPYIVTNDLTTSVYALAVISGVSNSTAYTFSNNSSQSSTNGTLAVGGLQQSVSLPTCNTFSIGSIRNAEILCSTISRITYYPKRLPNAQLQALTR